jgi:hypothetical protein
LNVNQLNPIEKNVRIVINLGAGSSSLCIPVGRVASDLLKLGASQEDINRAIDVTKGLVRGRDAIPDSYLVAVQGARYTGSMMFHMDSQYFSEADIYFK